MVFFATNFIGLFDWPLEINGFNSNRNNFTKNRPRNNSYEYWTLYVQLLKCSINKNSANIQVVSTKKSSGM